MRRARVLTIPTALLLVGMLCWAAVPATNTENPSLASYMPSGAVLYLQAKDFSGLLTAWNGSAVKQHWIESTDYREFSLSRVLLRLVDAQKEFTAVSSVSSDSAFLSQAAGGESAIGIYDIGDLTFLYVTRMPSTSAMQNALWQARGKFESRTAGGVAFYVSSDTASKRVVAFAVTPGYFLLSTREDLLAGALERMAGTSGPSLAADEWFSRAVTAAAAPGDVRLVLNMQRTGLTPQFRSYWIQQNVSEMKHYDSAVSDLYLQGSTYREERTLLHSAAMSPTGSPAVSLAGATEEGRQAVSDLLRLVPEDAGVYRAVANPSPTQAITFVEETIFPPRTAPHSAQQAAPEVGLTEGITGSAVDLETHIDVPPAVATQRGNSEDALVKVFEEGRIQAALLVQSSSDDEHTAFVEFHSALVVAAASNWSAEDVRGALASEFQQAGTTRDLGENWQEHGSGPSAYFALGGIVPEFAAVRGKYLVLANDVGALTNVLDRMASGPSVPPAEYAAGFSHSREADNFLRLVDELDSSGETFAASSSNAGGEPQFFSGNVASLSRIFSDLDSESIRVWESGDATRQTVTYLWKH